MVFIILFLLTVIASGFFMALAFMTKFWVLFGILVAVDIAMIIYATVEYGQGTKRHK